jgi:hypothetical protein
LFIKISNCTARASFFYKSLIFAKRLQPLFKIANDVRRTKRILKKLPGINTPLLLHNFGTESGLSAHSMGKGTPFPKVFPICSLVVCYLYRTRLEKFMNNSQSASGIFHSNFRELEVFYVGYCRRNEQTTDIRRHF